jgi:hypothetical protein
MEEEQVDITPRPTFTITLTKFELVHLRDLFNILLPPRMDETVSQNLAKSTNRSLIESKLWLKIAGACEAAELPLDEEAPDFTMSLVAAPALGVFELQHDPRQSEDDDEEEEESSPFSFVPTGEGCGDGCEGCQSHCCGDNEEE